MSQMAFEMTERLCEQKTELAEKWFDMAMKMASTEAKEEEAEEAEAEEEAVEAEDVEAEAAE